MSNLSSNFLTDILDFNNSITEFAYIYATNNDSAMELISEVTSGTKSPIKSKVQTLARGNLLLEITNEDLYNNPYVGIFYKVGTEYKSLINGTHKFQLNSFLGERRNLFLIKLEGKGVKAKFDLDESSVIIRHPHDLVSNSISSKNKVKNEVLIYKNSPSDIDSIKLVKGTSPNSREEYLPIGHGYILNLMRSNLIEGSTFSNINLLIVDSNFNSEVLPRYVNDNYFSFLSKTKYESRPWIPHCIRFKLSSINGYYIKLKLRGGSYPEVINGEVILTPYSSVSEGVQLSYKVQTSDSFPYLYLNTDMYSVIELESIGVIEFSQVGSQSGLTQETKESSKSGGFINPSITQSISEFESLNLRNNIKIPVGSTLYDKYRVYSSVTKTRYVTLTPSDVLNESSEFESLVSVSSNQFLIAMSRSGIPDSYKGPISIICNDTLRDSGYKIKLNLPSSVMDREISIIANYGSMIEVLFNNESLSVKNSSIDFMYLNGFVILNKFDTSIESDPEFNYGTLHYKYIGIFPRLDKNYLEVSVNDSFRSGKSAGVYGGVPSDIRYVYDVDNITGVTCNVSCSFELPKLGRVSASFGNIFKYITSTRYVLDSILLINSVTKFNGLIPNQVAGYSRTDLAFNSMSIW